MLASFSVVRQGVSGSSLSWQVVGWCERGAAIALLMLLLPAVLASAISIWLFSGRTPLIAHRRVGLGGSTLWMLKFRTMWRLGETKTGPPSGWIEHIADEDGPDSKTKSDPRVAGAFARFLRRHSIDELPQLWHVIVGEMSLVGPRPMTDRELRRHYGAQADEVLLIKPGLTGLWQVSGRNRLTFDERLRLDLALVREWSVVMYLAILVRTLPEILRGQNSW